MTEEREWNAEEILGINPHRSSGVMVEIMPTGPGRVAYAVSNLGPVQLTPDEVVAALRACADGIECRAR